jgi:predicted transcriptional regulator
MAVAHGAWVTQQAGSLLVVLGERGRQVRFVLRGRDARFCLSRIRRRAPRPGPL